MYKMLDFECNNCHEPFEALAEKTEIPGCPLCGSPDTWKTAVRSIGRPFEVIQATTLTSKKYKAGYVAEYKRPGTKIQVSVPAKLA